MTPSAPFNPKTDLQISRLMNARPETIWRCWAEPALFKQWFTPRPVEVTEVDNDLRAGGRAFNVMRLPDGTEVRNEGCFLLADPARQLVFSDAMQSGFRPAASPFMTCDLRLTPQANGTLYDCHVMHPTAEDRDRHVEMGFFDGWGTALEQLDALARAL